MKADIDNVESLIKQYFELKRIVKDIQKEKKKQIEAFKSDREEKIPSNLALYFERQREFNVIQDRLRRIVLNKFIETETHIMFLDDNGGFKIYELIK